MNSKVKNPSEQPHITFTAIVRLFGISQNSGYKVKLLLDVSVYLQKVQLSLCFVDVANGFPDCLPTPSERGRFCAGDDVFRHGFHVLIAHVRESHFAAARERHEIVQGP